MGEEDMAGWKDYLGDKAFYKKILAIALPISAQQLITVGVNLMDTVMLSSMGDAQLSASALGGQFINLFQIFCMGLGMGASVLTSRYWGMRELNSLKKAVTIMLRLCIIIGVAFSAATACLPARIIRIYSPDAAVITAGASYLRWSVLTYLLLGISLDLTLVLRSVGKAVVPLICSSIGFLSNLFFNWVFIFGKLGAPRMEVAGAALGTLLSRLIECTLIVLYFWKYETDIRYTIRDFCSGCGDLVREYMKICIQLFLE